MFGGGWIYIGVWRMDICVARASVPLIFQRIRVPHPQGAVPKDGSRASAFLFLKAVLRLAEGVASDRHLPYSLKGSGGSTETLKKVRVGSGEGGVMDCYTLTPFLCRRRAPFLKPSTRCTYIRILNS